MDQADKDDWRTRLIEERGFRVIRFWDNEVLTNIDGVVEVVEAALRGTSP
jgi:very-short-patch-repair endonuclease